MIVEEIMQTNLATLSPKSTIKDALQLMRERSIRHFPVVDTDNHIVGIVTDTDLRDATPSIFHSEEHKEDLNRPIEEIMKTNLITGHPLDFVEEIAAVFYENRISCVPIINDKQLVGIVTEADLLHTLIELTGANQPGSQIEIKVPHKTGVLCDIFSVFNKKKANVLSVLVYPDKHDVNHKIIVIRVQTMNPVSLIEELKKAGHHVLWPNLPGITL
ncbi:acetoin utilization AcuB family protein [Bacillus massilinigeriensis]|uniref:acetoin utilization AcuB family protein n=1 Tax=Bacillus massilionigeriensis TaxID=1805475 RepID=UPI00096AE042|nr:acetoin utilization AcuB family protein [Bacillus massilionigeriensis]